jgi:hypothetical protein
MKIYVGFSKPTGLFTPMAWIIRKVEKTAYSHVYLRWEEPFSHTECVFQANGHGVNFLELSKFLQSNTVCEEYEFEVSSLQYSEFMKFCMGQAGLRYGIIQILGIGLVRLFNLKHNPLSHGRKLQVCSELVGYFLEVVMGYDIPEDLDNIGPKGINNFIRGIKP